MSVIGRTELMGIIMLLMFGINADAYASNQESIQNNTLELNDIEAFTGTTIEVPVMLNNINDITAFQCLLNLSEGLSVNKTNGVYDITLTDRKGIDHQLTATMQQDGSIKLLCYSMQTLYFSGNEGTLFNIRVNISEDAVGKQAVRICNIILTSKNVKYTPSDIECTIDVKEINDEPKYELGDANGDSDVNVTDVVAITNYILGSSSENFQAEAADANGDGEINVTDVVVVTNIILGVSQTN